MTCAMRPSVHRSVSNPNASGPLRNAWSTASSSAADSRGRRPARPAPRSAAWPPWRQRRYQTLAACADTPKVWATSAWLAPWTNMWAASRRRCSRPAKSRRQVPTLIGIADLPVRCPCLHTQHAGPKLHHQPIPRSSLTGLLFCGICKRKLRAHVKRNSGKEQRVYYCNPQNARGGNHVTRDADKLDGLIEEALFRAIETDDFQEAATDLQPDDPTKPHVDRMAEITAELDVYGRMALEAEARELQGIPPKPGRSLVDIERKIAELEREYEREQTQYERKKDGRVRAYLPKNIRALWPDYSLDRRRNIIASVTEWIRIHPLPHSNVTDEQFVNAVEWEKKPAAWT